jgi:hypothetical protein
MATNKTRIIVTDATGAPNMSTVMEFDIYQDAIDYVKATCVSQGSVWGTSQCYIWLLSYDNESYRYQSAVVEPYYTESPITFPVD